MEEKKKFDVVVGNPPYKKDLHLKMLKKTVDHLSPGGEIIWLHPARWVQDPHAPEKSNSDFNEYHLLPFIELEFIPQGKASKLFGNEMRSDLSISHLKNGSKSILTPEKIYELRKIPISIKSIFNKNFISLKSVAEENKRDGIRVRIKTIIQPGHGRSQKDYNLYPKEEIIINGEINGKDWTLNVQKNQFEKPVGYPIPLSIKFSTEEEARNFINSTKTDFFLFLHYLSKVEAITPIEYLPFMKDYKNPWTNERFQEYFNLSNKDMEFIKERMIEIKNDPFRS